ncbi:MAG: hypothetical protein WA825_07180 [Steroidobacteraceae bacterium]
MKGIARVVWLLLWGSGLQNWLMVIGSAMTLGSLGALAAHWYPSAQSVFVFLGFMGVMLTVISPFFADAINFRSICGPRSIWLIPHGRLKLAAGAFLSQLLLAVFIGVAVGALLPAPAHATGIAAIQAMTQVLVMAFACLTLHFLCFYWVNQYRLGILVFLPYALLLVFLPGFMRSPLGAMLVSPIGLGTASTASVLAWVLFAIRLVTARHIRVAERMDPAVGAVSAAAASAEVAGAIPRYNTQQAMAILLSGIANPRRASILTALASCVLFAFIMLGLLLGKPAAKSALMWGFVLCCFGSLIPVAMVDALSRRASFLWLKPGLGRAELFRLVERGSWRRLLVGNITAFLLASPLVIYGTRFQHPAMIVFAILAAPVAAGAVLLYVWLLQVRGNVWRGALTMITAGLILLLQILFGAAAFVSGQWDASGLLLPWLVGIEILLVPVLRHIAGRRWQSIDWLVHRPVRLNQP